MQCNRRHKLIPVFTFVALLEIGPSYLIREVEVWSDLVDAPGSRLELIRNEY